MNILEGPKFRLSVTWGFFLIIVIGVFLLVSGIVRGTFGLFCLLCQDNIAAFGYYAASFDGWRVPLAAAVQAGKRLVLTLHTK